MDLDYEPDFILLGDGESFYAGSYYQHVGYGAGFSAPMRGMAYSAVAYRCAPSRLGLTWNENLMVTSIQNESIREAGLQEGDTLISLNGVPISVDGNSGHRRVQLSLQPGDDARFIWIRPGTGRMEGVGQAMENPPIHLDLVDAATIEQERIDAARKEDLGSPVRFKSENSK
jgi:hypothetical protein